ncbi:MAG TPA: hypothetical protein VFK07_01540, partial [Candidatus Paceibacterota bacterium]|nr:hypothetical protein [Candidatus Paceibacterota bacterium]
PDFSALVDYSKGFTRDDQLTTFETSGITNSSTGVTTYRESGKSEFGFWLITDPGKTKTVTVKYKVPKALDNDSYSLYVQKQPGLEIKDFSFNMQSPSGLTPTASMPLLKQSGDGYNYSAPLVNDLPLQVNFQ